MKQGCNCLPVIYEKSVSTLLCRKKHKNTYVEKYCHMNILHSDKKTQQNIITPLSNLKIRTNFGHNNRIHKYYEQQ